MGNAINNLRHLIDCYAWRDNRDMQDFIDAADMIDMQYVELPKDANGIEIRVGDDMEVVSGKFAGQHSAVEYLAMTEDGWEVDGEPPQSLRHYHAPTVEDILREFGDWYTHTKGGCDEDGIIADYAAKLQLAGDAAGPNELALAYHVGYDDALAKRKPDTSKVMQR